VSICWYKTEIIMIQLVKRKRQQNEDIRDKFRFLKKSFFFGEIFTVNKCPF
jgi:hypothetical protein